MGHAEPDAGPDTVRALGAFLLGEEPSLTRVEVAERAGVPLDLAVTLWHQLGFPHRADDDVAFVEGDVEALRLSAELVQIGILPPESQAALVRTWGRSYARLAEWQTSLLAGLAADGGDPADPAAGLAGLTGLAGDVLPRVEALQSYVWRRHLASAAEHLLDDASTLTASESQLSVCFVDIVGYTTQSRSLDGAALVQWVDGFEQETTALVVDHGGQVIKTIGDEVLFTVADPAAAVAVALGLAARGADEDDPFPAVRAGIAHGAVVRRLGDVFGSTVNAASRLTSAARPGSVLVDAGVHEALDSKDGEDGSEDDGEAPWRFRRARRISAKGFTHLEAWRVRPRVTGT
ncbi:adenylate/guanylate cyclase domain-containing protein [Nocardioides cavernae]|uniref:Adenylate/guanylate cyclase domain-containing protein n=1 Tax=Nocardioides cavernae TaxID=1921566 RepID=A0ABR8NA47_9ACTN|nr:adenylate/guanylate cyclase domain-containing protein [Nocardioides cavernae]MBD3924096.1 adenylate/guanylate cyclase domain-containing protein [Nocardioides cavernae]MBM7510966.1 adenylate cyclase [Nocardioides cavernae]